MKGFRVFVAKPEEPFHSPVYVLFRDPAVMTQEWAQLSVDVSFDYVRRRGHLEIEARVQVGKQFLVFRALAQQGVGLAQPVMGVPGLLAWPYPRWDWPGVLGPVSAGIDRLAVALRNSAPPSVTTTAGAGNLSKKASQAGRFSVSHHWWPSPRWVR